MGLDTKTDRLTDRQSQCDFDFDLWISDILRESINLLLQNVTLTNDRPVLSSQIAPYGQDNNFQTGTNIWSWVPDTNIRRLTTWPSVTIGFDFDFLS
jgi:hypothetical protein